MKLSVKSLLTLVALWIVGRASALAVTRIWDGQGGDGSFLNAANWDGNLTSAAANDDLQINNDMGGSGYFGFNMGTAFDATSLTYLATASAYVTTGTGPESLNLKLAGVALQNASGFRQVFTGLPVSVFPSTQTWNGGTNGFQFGTIDLGNDHVLTIDGTGATAATRNELSGKISGTGTAGLRKIGTGVLLFNTNAVSLYSGTTTISGGTLLLGRADQIPDASSLDFDGGTFSTGGFDERVAKLALTNNSVLDFGSSNTSHLAFSFSSDQNWGTFLLTVSNFDPGLDTWQVGTNGSALTPAQLNAIRFNGTTSAQISSTGYVTPVPEPSITSLLVMAGLGFAVRCQTRSHRASLN